MRHRTALITAGLIAAVILAGGVAMGANIGILNAADSRPVGTLSAVAHVQTGQSKAVRVYATGTPTSAQPQKYVIRKAGSVSVTAGKAGLRLADVAPKHGWTWSLAQTSDKKLTITFKHGGTTYTFVAQVGRHGAILARVDHPVTRVTPAAPSAAVAYSAPPAAATATAPPASSSQGGEPDDRGSGGGGADD
jgi:hypothetical protein